MQQNTKTTTKLSHLQGAGTTEAACAQPTKTGERKSAAWVPFHDPRDASIGRDVNLCERCLERMSESRLSR